jgi:hypothetical protein
MPKRLNVGKSRVIREKRLQELDRERRIRKGKQKSKK